MDRYSTVGIIVSSLLLLLFAGCNGLLVPSNIGPGTGGGEEGGNIGVGPSKSCGYNNLVGGIEAVVPKQIDILGTEDTEFNVTIKNTGESFAKNIEVCLTGFQPVFVRDVETCQTIEELEPGADNSLDFTLRGLPEERANETAMDVFTNSGIIITYDYETEISDKLYVVNISSNYFKNLWKNNRSIAEKLRRYTLGESDICQTTSPIKLSSLTVSNNNKALIITGIISKKTWGEIETISNEYNKPYVKVESITLAYNWDISKYCNFKKDSKGNNIIVFMGAGGSASFRCTIPLEDLVQNTGMDINSDKAEVSFKMRFSYKFKRKYNIKLVVHGWKELQ